VSVERSVLIVGSAPASDDVDHYVTTITGADFIIAADGGAVLCRLADRVPDVCVGDFDSAPPEVNEWARDKGAEIRRFPALKNESDLDLAVGIAREMGATSLTLTAAFTGRLDHTLAALGTLVRAADLNALADEPEWRAHALCSEHGATLALDETAGTVVSLIAVGGTARVSLSGFTYPLRDGELQTLSSLGLSNVVTSPPQSVTIHAGAVVVIANRRIPA
jgi:thiamine pyrophosphokinase